MAPFSSEDTIENLSELQCEALMQPSIASDWTAADYAETVKRFSLLRTGAGSGHGRLASFLSPLILSQPRPQVSASLDTPFLTLYDFKQEADPDAVNSQLRQTAINQQNALPVLWKLRGPLHIDSPERIAAFGSSAPSPGRILFLRGFPSAEWLGSLGSTHVVDPEFFKNWLDFPHTPERHNQFSSPSLPSAGWNILELPLITIGRRNSFRTFKTQSQLDTARSELAESIRHYQTELLMDKHKNIGGSIARDIDLFDETHFAIEQKVTICLQPQAGSKDWVLLIWSDAGEDLGHSSIHNLWQSACGTIRQPHTFNLMPIVNYRPSMGLVPDKLSGSFESDIQQTLPCASRLHLSYGTTIQPQIMIEDPFYALNDVFALAAASEKQFLNLIEQKLAQYSTPSDENFDALPNLRYIKQVVIRQTQHISLARSSIQTAQSSKWPSACTERGERMRRAVELDWAHLENASRELDSRCQEAITVLMSTVTIQDAKKAIAQAQRVAKLTFLAFIFVPLSFTTSFFGMNFRELEDLSIWRWVVMSAPIMMATLTVFFVDGKAALRLWRSFILFMKGQ